MHYYRPPKKNCFGHSMKRFSPEKQLQLATDFLERASIGSNFRGSTLTIGSPLGAKNTSFQALIESAAEFLDDAIEMAGGSVNKELDPDEFRRCIRWLIEVAPLPNAQECYVMVARNHQIPNWSIEGVSMPTESSLNEIYGTLPTVQPLFSFETRPQYEFVKAVARDLGYFTMNDAHLKES